MLEPSNWKITQGYGLTPFAKSHPNLYKSFGGIHPGIDFIGDTEIMPFVSGVVTQAGWQDGWGFSVTINDGQYYHLYAHLSKYWVRKGERVSAWETKIGVMGTTGTSFGVHLHYSKYVKTLWIKTYIDPTNDLLFNETNMLIQKHVDKNKKAVEDILNGVTAYGFDKGRQQPYRVTNGAKKYYKTFNELFATEFLFWVESQKADEIPNE